MIERRWGGTLTAALVNGVLQAATPGVASDELWMVDTIVLSASAPVGAICCLYHGDALPANYILRSVNAAQDTFEGQLEIPGGTCLTFVWSGQVGSAQLFARWHYTRYAVETLPSDLTLLGWRAP